MVQTTITIKITNMKQTFKVIGHYLLRRAFIETLQLEGWEPAGSGTYNNLIEAHERAIEPANTKEYWCGNAEDWVYMHSVGVTYTLPTDWDKALQAFRDWCKPSVEEKTWIITAFIENDNTDVRWKLRVNGLYCQDGYEEYGTYHKLNNLLHNSTIHIWSSKATPESEELTIGDWIASNKRPDMQSQITGFIINEFNNLLAVTSQYKKGIGLDKCHKVVPVVLSDDKEAWKKNLEKGIWVMFQSAYSDIPDGPYQLDVKIDNENWKSTKGYHHWIVKGDQYRLCTPDEIPQSAKNLLFTTEDGVEIYTEDEILFSVCDHNNWWKNNPTKPDKCSYRNMREGIRNHKETIWHVFHSSEKAIEYMKYRKKPYMKDHNGNDICIGDEYWCTWSAKSMHPENPWIAFCVGREEEEEIIYRFTTKAAALEYIASLQTPEKDSEFKVGDSVMLTTLDRIEGDCGRARWREGLKLDIVYTITEITEYGNIRLNEQMPAMAITPKAFKHAPKKTEPLIPMLLTLSQIEKLKKLLE